MAEEEHNDRTVMDWYAPNDISRFTQVQVCWLLDHIRTLKAGHYPREPVSTMTDLPGIKRRRAGAYFEAPTLIYAELITRLEKCGLDGLILVAREGLEMSEDELGAYFNQPAQKIHKRAQTALRYVSGRERKWHKRGKLEAISYHDFKHYKKHAQNRNLSVKGV